MRSFFLGITIVFLLFSCKSKSNLFKGKDIITKACDLKNRVNDTVLIKGVYHECMEYSKFNTVLKDSCYKNFNMELNFENIQLSQSFEMIMNSIEGCVGTIDMTLVGILKNDKLDGYGHLGSNNLEFFVIQIIESGKLKYIEP